MRNIINQLMNWGHNGSEQRNSQLGLSRRARGKQQTVSQSSELRLT